MYIVWKSIGHIYSLDSTSDFHSVEFIARPREI